MTAEQAEQAVVSANKRKQRESYLREVRDSGAVVVDLPLVPVTSTVRRPAASWRIRFF